jgi:CheY-like chemotaxis protein
MRILVVDDDAMAGEMTGAVLEDMGHEVILAEDGKDAQRKLDGDATIKLILSDMNMPGLSGIELFHLLREQGRTVPFILLTGDDPEDLRAREPGLDACVLKDFNLEETLPVVLGRVLEGKGTS